MKSGGTVLLTEVPEFCGAEHILANRAKDATVGRKIYAMVDWYKEYASKIRRRPRPESEHRQQSPAACWNITIKSLGAIIRPERHALRTP
ncbi:MAG: UxaA family hydrolase [Acidobacteria bacterium]|nr:UxaA family hydrolase [Acidobacteriota bacterium]